MAVGDTLSNPTRFLQGQDASDVRKLGLEQFGGEVLAAFDLNTVFKDRIQRKSLPRGSKGWRFPKTWKATAEYHTPGVELMGNKIDTTDILVTPDDILVAHTAIADIDEMLSHFEVSGQFSMELGRALSRMYDANAARQLILAARTAADGVFPAATALAATDALKPTAGVYSGSAWLTAIRSANAALYAADVPEDAPRYLAVPRGVFDGLKYTQDANGNYLFLNSLLNQGEKAGGPAGRGQTLDVDGVTVFPTRNLPNTNETSTATVYPKYRADFSKTLGIMWHDMAAASVVLQDVTIETERDTRRLENFMVAHMLNGFGTLRPECAVEFKSIT